MPPVRYTLHDAHAPFYCPAPRDVYSTDPAHGKYAVEYSAAAGAVQYTRSRSLLHGLV